MFVIDSNRPLRLDTVPKVNLDTTLENTSTTIETTNTPTAPAVKKVSETTLAQDSESVHSQGAHNENSTDTQPTAFSPPISDAEVLAWLESQHNVCSECFLFKTNHGPYCPMATHSNGQ